MIITATEITRTGYFYKYTCSDRSIGLCFLWDAHRELFCFGDFYASGTQDAEVIKSLKFHKGALVIIFFSYF